MFDRMASAWFRVLGKPCFRIHGKARGETQWRQIEVHATPRRNHNSRWPAFLFRGTCITWTPSIIAVGWDFAEEVLAEQMQQPASRDRPVEVIGGRLRNALGRFEVSGEPWPSASEVLAHEIGHTWQARRMTWLYWPIGAAFTLCREGQRWWNWFENQASAEGQFGGIINGSVCPELFERLRRPGNTPDPGGLRE